MRLFLACVVLSMSFVVVARDFSQDFAVVLANEKTEARFGTIPLDRTLIAKAIANAARYGAKGVVVKFFLDQPRGSEGDQQLAQSLSMLPVILQARIDDTEKSPNVLPERLTMGRTHLQSSVQGESGWIPLPALADASHAVCFADFNASPIPLLETYRGNTVKSLLLCPVELAVGQKAVIRPEKEVSVGDLRIPLDGQNRVSLTVQPHATFPIFQFDDLIDGTLAHNALKGRVVVLGYDGPHIHTVMTPVGKVGAHRAYILLLKAFYEYGS